MSVRNLDDMVTELSNERKAKMAAGRRETRVVDLYLKRLAERTSSTAPRTVEQIESDAAAVEEELGSADGAHRLELLQRREDLQVEAMEVRPDDFPAVEAEFIDVAASYGERKNISYSTWREFGVAGPVLKAAGIKRSRRPYGNT